MAIEKYYFDTETLQYKRVQVRTWQKYMKVALLALLTLVAATIMAAVYKSYFEMPKEVQLKNQIKELGQKFAQLNHRLVTMSNLVASIEERDDNLYRTVLGVEPLDEAVRRGGVGGSERYTEIREKKIEHKDLIVQLYENLDKLNRKVYVESVSQDELTQLAEKRQKLYAAIPAIQPVANKQLIALTSGFGLRLDPFHSMPQMHTGIDFSAEEGTPVYATADGVVLAADTDFVGFGTMVIIDHGHGYITRYAHLLQFKVAAGDHVTRGEQIAWVGNTGLSTAPHLHYEVLLDGDQIDPIDYFYNDLNAEEYEKLVQLASIQNRSLESNP